jgi:hypothetical protein
MVGKWIVAVQAGLALAAQTPPAVPSPQEDGNSGGPIIVNGYPIRCHPRPNDPLDAASAAAPTQYWYFIVPKPEGGFRYERGVGGRPPDGEFTRLDRWRRAGDALPSFVFRQPDDGSPLCIGKRPHTPSGTVQLQQTLAAEPYRCRSVRLTMFVASRKAAAWVWLNGGGSKPILFPFDGNHGWTPVKIEWGPVEWGAPWLGFGVIAADGDVWFYDPKLAIISDAELSGHARRLEDRCRAALERWERLRRDHPGVAARSEHPEL